VIRCLWKQYKDVGAACVLSKIAQHHAPSLHLAVEDVSLLSPIQPWGAAVPRSHSVSRVQTLENSLLLLRGWVNRGRNQSPAPSESAEEIS
jgi:hypothetical protein